MSALCILNGCALGETNGRMTCNTAQGPSVVDHILMSAPLARAVHAIALLDKCAESDHCPLTLDMMTAHRMMAVPENPLQWLLEDQI